MTAKKARRGIAMGLVVLIITILFVTVFSILNLMRGVGDQLSHADAHVRSLVIAESGVNLLLSRLMAHPWEERWFRNAPDFRGSPVAWGGGSFIYAIQDTPGVSRTADIWVKGKYRAVRRLLFYRVRYEDLLFHGLTDPSVNFTADLDAGRAPGALGPGAVDGLTDQMNELVERKAQTRGLVAYRWEDLAGKIDLTAIMARLVANVPTDGIPVVSVAPPGGGSTAVEPRPAVPPPSGAGPSLASYDKGRIEDWIKDQGFDPEYAAYLMNAADRNFEAIDRLVDKNRLTEAERMLKEFLSFLMNRAVRVQAARTTARMRYDEARAKIAADLATFEAQARAQVPPMPEEEFLARRGEFLARKEALRQAFERELAEAMASDPAPSP